MKKGKMTMTITIGLICFVLVYVMFLQFRVIEETNIAGIEDLREAELTEKLAEWKSKSEELKVMINEKDTKIKEYENALYMRVDLVKIGEDYKVMELELVEPQLFLAFRKTKKELIRFAKAIREKI